MIFLDTNIIIRLLTNDSPKISKKIVTFFKKAEKDGLELYIPESIFCEIVYVLSSKKTYNAERTVISKKLTSIMLHTSVKVPDHELFAQALSMYTSHNLDFEDCLLIVRSHSNEVSHGILTLDKGIKSISGVQNIEL